LTLQRLAMAGLGWPLPAEMTDAALEARLFTEVGTKQGHRRRAEPDWAAVHRELKRKHVTLQMLWDEYVERCPAGYRYSRFCELYRGWASRLSVTMRQSHAGGDKLFVDYAGDTVPVIIDRLNGKTRPAQIFVAVLGASNFTYAEASWTQALGDWIGAHTRTFAAIGGVPRLLVPDYVPGNIIGLLCPPRLCGEPLKIAVAVTAIGHISIKGQRAIRAALVRSAKLVFGEVPAKRSKEAGTPPMLPASS
jgi:transposase